MNLKRLFIALTLSVMLPAMAFAAPLKKNIHDNWKFVAYRIGANWQPATVPGCVHTDLMANGMIEDPFFRLNERQMQWVDKQQWIYQTKFDVSDDMFSKDNIELCFEGLDTYATVTLNEDTILVADNMFRTWKADVKKLLKKEDNRLQVFFESPVMKAQEGWEKLPYQHISDNDQSWLGGMFNRRVGVHARKPGYHFGWDWGPRLVPTGIWKPVVLEAWNDAKINNVFYSQTSVTAKEAVIDVKVEVISDKDIKGAEIVINNDTDHKKVTSAKVNLKKGLNTIPLKFTVRNPKLWWTNGLGEAFLYDFSADIRLKGKQIDQDKERVGLRSIRVVIEPDEIGESFYFEINGVPIFAKGTNYIPNDIFLNRVTDEIYTRTINDAVAANMNMIRIWGGGIYEADKFYELCDENGLLVWQDFMFACSTYPADEVFLENVRQEAIDNVKRLRNHACIALWCGNNECLDMWFNWGVQRRIAPEYRPEIWEQFKQQYYVVLPQVVEEYHPGICYRKSSPYADDFGAIDTTRGDMHYWGVWQGRKPISEIDKEKSRFVSEYGFQSFPEFSTIKQFAPDPADWKATSDVMMSHQRGGGIANSRIDKYLTEEYGKPVDFEYFTYLSQLLQGDLMKLTMEFHRRDRPYCMGSLIWQHNDCWPVASWSSIDYYGRWKALHYFMAKSFDDIMLSPIEKNGKFEVHAISDRLKDAEGTLRVMVNSVDGQYTYLKSLPVVIPANTSTLMWTGNVDELLKEAKSTRTNSVITVEFVGDRTYRNNFFPAKHVEIEYPEADVKTSVKAVDGGYEVTMSSDKFVRAAFLVFENGADYRFSDNFIDLLPNEEVTVKVTVDKPVSQAQFEKELRVIHLAGARKSK